jgi:uncharacterized protein YjbI with pentapeptide repeats
MNLDGVNCSDCYLRGVVFQQGSAKGADFRGAHLDSARFYKVELERAHFEGASFGADVQFFDCDLESSRFAPSLDNLSQQETKYDFRLGSLRWSDLEEMRLVGGTFADVDMRGANLARSDLSGALLSRVSVDQDTSFKEAVLHGAHLDDVRIESSVRLVGTTIDEASLHGLDVSKVDFSNVDFSGGEFFAGEEREADADARDPTVDPNARILKQRRYAEASAVYRALATKFQQASALREFRWCRFRAMSCRRKYLSVGGDGGRAELAYLYFIWCVDGYGTSPGRLIIFSFAVMLCFALCYISFALRSHRAEAVSTVQSDTQSPWRERGLACVTAITISMEGQFAAIGRLAGMPDVLMIVYGRSRSSSLSQFLRIVFGVQALVGAFVLARAIRIWLLFFG